MATPDPPPGSGTVTVASQGAAAFVGDVYYLADGRTGDPILGWPEAAARRVFAGRRERRG